ncbi:MAG: 3-hydroxyacyl-CoA dehydrogenase/enoyl-CoA hydratase family protein [Conexivisphaerales archaeon]
MVDITNVAVIGAGEMGHGIAQVFATYGFQVSLMDKYPEALEKAKERVKASLARQVERGRLKAEDAEQAFNRIVFTGNMQEAVKAAELVIEAVPERIELKIGVFSELENHAKPEAIFATNTSNIRITDIANATKRPDKFAGLHFFNPPVSMKLVEIIPSAFTEEEVLKTLEEVCRRIGKTPVRVLKDSPGFIVNRINAADVLLFSIILDKSLAKPEEVDAFAKSQGLPMGPYELLDFVGIDIAYDSLKYFADTVSKDYARFETLQRMVQEQRLGRKTGKGFYEWVEGRAKIPQAEPTDKVSVLDLFAIEINEAVKLIEEGVARPDDIEKAVVLGMNRPFGPISVAKSYTSQEIASKLQELAERFECKVFYPTAAIREGKLREAVEGRLAIPQQMAKQAEVKKAEKAAEIAAEEVVTVERPTPQVAVVRLARGSHNLINGEMLDGIARACKNLEEDKEVRVVVFTGRGKDLSAGADVSQFFASSIDFVEFSRKGQMTMQMIKNLPQLTIAVMKGNVLGGGLELALSCDLRIASQDCSIGFPEVRLGLVPGWSGTQRSVKLLGLAKAARLVLTGERIDGKEALEIGLAHTLVQDSDAEAFAIEAAKELSLKLAPASVRLGKRLLSIASETSLDDGLAAEAMAMGALYGTEDLKEGISAFLQKRQAVFKGR